MGLISQSVHRGGGNVLGYSLFSVHNLLSLLNFLLCSSSSFFNLPIIRFSCLLCCIAVPKDHSQDANVQRGASFPFAFSGFSFTLHLLSNSHVLFWVLWKMRVMYIC